MGEGLFAKFKSNGWRDDKGSSFATSEHGESGHVDHLSFASGPVAFAINMSEELPVVVSAAAKLMMLVKTVTNWPVVALDKAGVMSHVRYQLRTGGQFLCRSCTPDVNEVVVVSSGFEYPLSTVEHVPTGGVVLDIGANIGTFSVFVSRHNHTGGIRGWSIEPFASNVSLLRRNLALNAVNFDVAELAISDHDGYCRIDTSVPPDAVSVTTDAKGALVKCMRLSTFCADRQIERVSLLKIDIEGHEYAVFESDHDFLCHRVRSHSR